MKKVLAVLAVAGLASTAMAQSFDAAIGFRNDHSLANPTPNVTNPYQISAPGTYQFEILFGAHNATGFTNRGMFNFIAAMNMTDPAGSTSMAPRASAAIIAPYSFGNVFANPNPTTITFDANRGAGSVDNIPWIFGNPAPADVYTYPAFGPGGASGAPNTYHPGFRFEVTVTDVTPRTVTIDVTGTMQAISNWFVTTEQEPEDGFPGFQNLLPGGFVQTNASGQLVIELVPAPGAAALLGLGGLVAARRRRA